MKERDVVEIKIKKGVIEKMKIEIKDFIQDDKIGQNIKQVIEEDIER